MDTSREYVLMCKYATEIQKEWKPLRGDYAYNFNWGTPLHIVRTSDLIDNMTGYLDGCILLPRQDQLQDMLRVKGWARQLEIICSFANILTRDFEWSWEQFWLALVMKENFNKFWLRGNNWTLTNKEAKHDVSHNETMQRIKTNSMEVDIKTLKREIVELKAGTASFDYVCEQIKFLHGMIDKLTKDTATNEIELRDKIAAVAEYLGCEIKYTPAKSWCYKLKKIGKRK